MRAIFDFISTAKKMPDKDGFYLTINEVGNVHNYSYCCEYGEFNTSKYSHEFAVKGIKFWAEIPEELQVISKALLYEYIDSKEEEINE